NDQIGDYQYLNTYSFGNYQYLNKVGIYPTRLFNPDYSWETNKKLELALDLGLFRDRIRINGVYYRNRSSNQLVGIPLPRTTGFASVNANLGATVENKGLELGFTSVNIDKSRFYWEMSLNLTFPKNKLISFPNLEGSTYSDRLVIGKPLDIVKVYKLKGVDPDSGLYSFEDFNGDGIITYDGDRESIISLDPNYYGGLTNKWIIGKLSVDVLLQFTKQKGENYWSTGGVIPGGLANQPKEVMERWTNGIENAPIQMFSTGLSSEQSQAFRQFTQSDAAISDASFARLKSLTINYNLFKKENHGVGCDIYFMGQNLFTLTNYLGLDPENKNSA